MKTVTCDFCGKEMSEDSDYALPETRAVANKWIAMASIKEQEVTVVKIGKEQFDICHNCVHELLIMIRAWLLARKQEI